MCTCRTLSKTPPSLAMGASCSTFTSYGGGSTEHSTTSIPDEAQPAGVRSRRGATSAEGLNCTCTDSNSESEPSTSPAIRSRSALSSVSPKISSIPIAVEEGDLSARAGQLDTHSSGLGEHSVVLALLLAPLLSCAQNACAHAPKWRSLFRPLAPTSAHSTRGASGSSLGGAALPTLCVKQGWPLCHYLISTQRTELLQAIIDCIQHMPVEALSQAAMQLGLSRVLGRRSRKHGVMAGWRLALPMAMGKGTSHRADSAASLSDGHAPDQLLTAQEVVSAFVNLPCSKGLTPLMQACAGGNDAAIKVLVTAGANLWAIGVSCKRSALHLAAAHRHHTCVQALLSNARPEDLMHAGVQYVDVRTAYGMTPLMLAALSGSSETVAALRVHAASILDATWFDSWDLRQVPEAGSNALHMVAYSGNEAAAYELLRCYAERVGHTTADPRARRDKGGHLPWQIAQSLGHSTVASALCPSADVHTVLARAGLGPIALPTLVQLASKAMQEGLLASLEKAMQSAAEEKRGSQGQLGSEAAPINLSPSEVSASCSDQGSQPSGRSHTVYPADATEEDCGVCLSQAHAVRVHGCGHALCGECASQMVQRMRPGAPLACPFCRGPVRGFVDVKLLT